MPMFQLPDGRQYLGDTYGRPCDVYGRLLDAQGRPTGQWGAFGDNPAQAAPQLQAPPPPTPGPDARAVLQMPNTQDLGGKDPNKPAWYRLPFFPTAPFWSTREDVGYEPRDYSNGCLSTDADYVVGAELTRNIQFDIPCRIIAINGSSFKEAGFPVGIGPRSCWLFRMEYTTGNKLQISQRLADTVVGTAERPGEIGGTGWTVGVGGTVTIGITPLLAGLRIDVTLICMEIRGPTNITAK